MTAVTVTALARKPRSKLLEVSLDGVPGFRVTPDIAVQFGLRPGAELTTARLEHLRAAQAGEDAMAAALRLVSYHARSEKELRDRLRQRGVDAPLVEATVERLKELRLLDDRAFAASWVESRDRTGPRSRRLLASELRLKGVAREPADAATAAVDEVDAAYRAAAKRAHVLTGRSFEEFRRKVGELLLRRGFSYAIANDTVRRLWRETGGSKHAWRDREL